MKKSNLCLDVFTENLAGMQAWQEEQRELLQEGKPQHQEMLRVLRRALQEELTPRQQECVRLYYFEGMTMQQASRFLGIGTPAVSKHLKKARRRLGRVMSYAFERLAS